MKRALPGYTLIEMIAVIAIASITLVATTAAIILFYRSNLKSLNQAYAVESARTGMQHMVADIRGIQYGADGSYPVSSIATSSFVFYTDTNGDGVAERVEYYLSGTNLIRGITYYSGIPPVYTLSTESTTTVSSYVRNNLENVSLFSFYTSTSTQITTYSTTTRVAYVSVALVVNQNISTSTGDYTLRSTAALRNVSQF